MPTTEERLTVLETNDKNIFHQLDEIKAEQKEQGRLVVAVEKLANKTDTIAEKVDKIDGKLETIEAEPGRQYNRVKDIVITAIITTIVGAIVGSVLTLIMK